MRGIKSILFVGVIIFLFTLTGCYTVVMVPRGVLHRGATGDIIPEEEPGEYAEADSEQVPTAVYKYYIYGDLLPGYTYFDPYWASPYWWHYSSGWPYGGYYDPWFGDPWPYYGGYSPWYSYSPYYYNSGYYDPYWAYWDGYYSTVPMKRRPFSRRRSFTSQTDSYAPSASARSGGRKLSKTSGTGEIGGSRRVRKDLSSGSMTSKPSKSSNRSVSRRRIRKPSSDTVIKKTGTSTKKSSGGAVRVRKRRSSSSVRKTSSRRKYSSPSRRVRRSSSSTYTRRSTYHPSSSSSSSGSYTGSRSSSGHASSSSSSSSSSRRRRK